MHGESHLVGRPRPVGTSAVTQSHRELVTVGKGSRDRLPRRERHSDCAFSAARIEHALFQLQALVAVGKSCQISARRMTLYAPSGAIEIVFACLRISSLEIFDGHSPTAAGMSLGRRFTGADERDDAGDLLAGEIEAGHFVVRLSLAHNG